MATWYEAVQVVERTPEGKILRWYDGDKHPSAAAAKREAQQSAAEYPGVEYQVIQRGVSEIGVPIKKEKS